MSHEITRVYRPEWIIVYYASAGGGDTCESLCARAQQHADERYRGRVRADDVRIECTGEGMNALCTLQLRLPTMKGEFKSRVYAERFVADKGWTDTTLVTRNSPEDYVLRNYSITMLPETRA